MAEFMKFLSVSQHATSLLKGLIENNSAWEQVDLTKCMATERLSYTFIQSMDLKLFEYKNAPDDYKKFDKFYDFTHGRPWDLKIYKSVGYVDSNVKTLIEFLRDPHHYLSWNKNCISYTVVDVLDNDTDIAYASYGPKLSHDTVTPVDFVFVRHFEQFSNSFLESIQSVEIVEKPPVDGFTRAFMYPSGWILRDCGNRTEVNFVVCFDLKGATPNKHIRDQATLVEAFLFLPNISEFLNATHPGPEKQKHEAALRPGEKHFALLEHEKELCEEKKKSEIKEKTTEEAKFELTESEHK